MQNRAELKAELELIKNDALSDNNPYKLGYSEKNDLTTVIRTLIFLLDHMDRVRNLGYCYFPDQEGHAGVAPIHLENYVKNGRPLQGDECEAYITASLISLFINIFKNLKGMGGEHIKIYCSKMNSYCIDGRTREAFDYGLQFANNLPFTDMFNFAIKKLALSNQGSYCWITTTVLNHIWGKEFTPDKGAHAIAKQAGRIDEILFAQIEEPAEEEKGVNAGTNRGLINQYLRQTSYLTPNSDFLLAYKTVTPNMLKTYFKIIFAQPELTEGQIFVPSRLPAGMANPILIKKYNALRQAGQTLFDDFIIEQYLTLIAMTTQGDIKKEVLRKLIQTASPITLLEIWKQPEFAGVIGDINNKECTTVLVEAMLAGIQADPIYLKEFFETPLTTGETVIHFVTQSNDADLVNKAIHTATAAQIDIWKPNSDGDSPIVYAVKHERWNAIAPLLVEEKADVPEQNMDVKRREYGKALLITTAHNKSEISASLIKAGAQTNLFLSTGANPTDSVVHLAARQNNTEIIDLLVTNATDINQVKLNTANAPTALVVAASSPDVNLETMVHILMYVGDDIDKHNQGLQALAGAVRSNNAEKSVILLTRGINAETALIILDKDASEESKNILRLFSLVERILENRLQDSLNIKFLADMNKAFMDQIFALILSVKSYTEQQINLARNILYKAYDHARGQAARHEALSFNEQHYERTTAVLNNMLRLAHNSDQAEKYKWQGDVRNGGFDQLEMAVDAEPDLLKKKELLTKARKETIFSEHRSQFFLFRIGRTGAQIKIDDKLTAVNREIAAAGMR